jgi:hypothetical protein
VTVLAVVIVETVSSSPIWSARQHEVISIYVHARATASAGKSSSGEIAVIVARRENSLSSEYASTRDSVSSEYTPVSTVETVISASTLHWYAPSQ